MSLMSERFFSWMGPSSTRMMIVDKNHREISEKRQRGVTGLSTRHTERSDGRPTLSRDGVNIKANGYAASSGPSQGARKIQADSATKRMMTMKKIPVST